MKISRHIRCDEKYPVYELSTEPVADYDTAIEMTADELIDYEEVLRRYRAWQTRFREVEYHDRNS